MPAEPRTFDPEMDEAEALGIRVEPSLLVSIPPIGSASFSSATGTSESFAHNGAKLDIHRQTLYYRLTAIEERMGLRCRTAMIGWYCTGSHPPVPESSDW